MKILVILSALILTSPMVYAKDDQGKHTGDGSSLEHKSESGLEHGNAYAGEKEKEEKEEKEEKDKKDKKDKSDSEDDKVKKEKKSR